MRLHKGTKWLCENARRLEKFSGQWVVFNEKQGMVSKGRSLEMVLRSARSNLKFRPFVFHVPSRKNR